MDHSSLLWSFTGILTHQRYQALIDVYGSLSDAGKHLGEELLIGLGCKSETVREVLMRIEEFDVQAYEAELKERGITFLTIDDPGYPEKLRAIADAPPFLYARGDFSVLDQPCIACVGTRQMTLYGRRVVDDIVPGLIMGGAVTVSGLALGIDAAVAEATLRSGGRTVAVLGHGLGTIYPKSHEKLAEKIIAGGGLILSEFPLNWPPGQYTFPQRNRIIAGLSLATVVLEAPTESGALITAEFALEEGRDVLAVPGQIFDPSFAGCHTLIAKNQAKLVTSAADILQEVGLVAREAGTVISKYTPQTEDEDTLLRTLTSMPQTTDDLIEKSGLDVGRVNTALTMMELVGAAKNVGGGQWVRS